MPSIFRKPVSIDRGVYTMAMADGQNAEITMYGEIVRKRPVDDWTGKPIPGDYIIESEFLQDLDKLNAQANSGFKSTFTQAQAEFARLGNEIQSLNRTQADISAYQK